MTSFPDGEARLQVSTAGGYEPTWSTDGRAIYYRAATGILSKAHFEVREGIPRVKSVEPLFELVVGAPQGDGTYAVAADGRILAATLSEEEVDLPYTLILNWK